MMYAGSDAASRLVDGIKKCSLCGVRFGCRAGQPGCWCERVAVTSDALAALRMVAADCVCPACLAGWAEAGIG